MNSPARTVITAAIATAVAWVLLTLIQSLDATVQMIATPVILFAAILAAALLSSGGTGATAGADDGDDAETGTVKWFNVKKGYGFITRDSGDDVFVHYRNILGEGRRAIQEGQRVSFVVVSGDKGPQADRVSAI